MMKYKVWFELEEDPDYIFNPTVEAENEEEAVKKAGERLKPLVNGTLKLWRVERVY